jgi:4-amino-4-deoxy-L-arabinose transferase-like glycosyltransferase
VRPSRAHLILLVALILAALALRFWRLGAMPLSADEAYYLLWTGRLAPAYVDHPAGIALLLKLSTALFGRSEFGVRWLNAMLSTLCVPLAYAVGRRYVSTLGGIFAAIVVAFGPVYLITGRVAYPDTLQMALMLVNLLSLAPLLEGRGTLPRWALFGFTLALLFNVKLSSGFYAIALGIYLLGWRRDLLRQRGLWLALGLAALGLLPVIGWNAAHNWGMVRWAIYQGRGFGLPQPGLRVSLVHAWRYLTPPASLLAGLAAVIAVLGLVSRQGRANPRVAGDIRARRPAGALMLVAACLLIPILLSAANSPRNLGVGLLALWPLAGAASAMPDKPGVSSDRGRPVNRWPRALYLMAVPLCLWLALYGVGTTAALLGPTHLPANIVAPAIRSDATGWPEFAVEANLPADEVAFAVDYGITGQVARYAGRSVYSAHPQFRLWGLPDFNDLTVLSQDFIPPELITERLQADFSSMSEPRTWRYEAAGVSKTVYIWRAHGRQVSVTQMLDDLDFLGLAQATNARLR